MKKTLFFLALCFVMPFCAEAQVYPGLPNDSALIRFNSDTSSNFIPDTAAAPLWQIGTTYKPFFAPDSIPVLAIMTDTIIQYPINANNWFAIKIAASFNVIIDFWHKYQTTANIDGGVVEFSVDSGTTWQNIIGACSGLTPGTLTNNFYTATDTLFNGEPGFSGNSDSIIYSRFQFFDGLPERVMSGGGCTLTEGIDSIYIRFRFISDSIADTLAGWMIDSIKIENDLYGGYTPVVNISDTKISPNPASDELTIKTSTTQPYTLTLLNMMGQAVYSITTSNQQETIDVSMLPAGVYEVNMEYENGNKYHDKAIIVH